MCTLKVEYTETSTCTVQYSTAVHTLLVDGFVEDNLFDGDEPLDVELVARLGARAEVREARRRRRRRPGGRRQRLLQLRAHQEVREEAHEAQLPLAVAQQLDHQTRAYQRVLLPHCILHRS